jgi:hypothetical protein
MVIKVVSYVSGLDLMLVSLRLAYNNINLAFVEAPVPRNTSYHSMPRRALTPAS